VIPIPNLAGRRRRTTSQDFIGAGRVLKHGKLLVHRQLFQHLFDAYQESDIPMNVPFTFVINNCATLTTREILEDAATIKIDKYSKYRSPYDRNRVMGIQDGLRTDADMR
jgi:hypothetical protein